MLTRWWKDISMLLCHPFCPACALFPGMMVDFPGKIFLFSEGWEELGWEIFIEKKSQIFWYMNQKSTELSMIILMKCKKQCYRFSRLGKNNPKKFAKMLIEL